MVAVVKNMIPDGDESISFVGIYKFIIHICFIDDAIIQIVSSEQHFSVSCHRHIIWHSVIEHTQKAIWIHIFILACTFYISNQMPLLIDKKHHQSSGCFIMNRAII